MRAGCTTSTTAHLGPRVRLHLRGGRQLLWESGVIAMPDALSDPMPMLCELCFSPVVSLGYVSGGHARRTLRDRLHTLSTAVKATDWPGTHGLPVWFHSRCYQTALDECDRNH